MSLRDSSDNSSCCVSVVLHSYILHVMLLLPHPHSETMQQALEDMCNIKRYARMPLVKKATRQGRSSSEASMCNPTNKWQACPAASGSRSAMTDRPARLSIFFLNIPPPPKFSPLPLPASLPI